MHSIVLHRTIVLLISMSIVVSATFVPKGRKCRLQEQHCDIMHPEKQCCPGTSCGIRRINNQIVNICQMCRDIGQPCSDNKGACCGGLKCQRVTKFASVCNPVDYKFFADDDDDDDDDDKSGLGQQQRLTKNKKGIIKF